MIRMVSYLSRVFGGEEVDRKTYVREGGKGRRGGKGRQLGWSRNVVRKAANPDGSRVLVVDVLCGLILLLGVINKC